MLRRMEATRQALLQWSFKPLWEAGLCLENKPASPKKRLRQATLDDDAEEASTSFKKSKKN